MQNTARCSKITVSADGKGLVSQAGGLLLAETLRVTGLGRAMSGGLARWRAPRAVHDPGKILTDVVVALVLGGDCLADAAVVRAQPALYGPVASDPVVSRLVSTLAADGPRALRAIRRARAAARERAWALAGDAAPGADGSLIPVDIDATIVLAHSEKEKAAPTWKKTYGFHPLAAFADHGGGAGGEALAILLRAGNAGSNTASEHIEVTRLALAQLPRKLRRRVLIRTDSGGGTHDFLTWLASPSRRLRYSVGMTITEDMQQAIMTVPERVWEPAYDADGEVRPGAWVAELTGLLDLAGWPAGMRVIVRRERPHPGAQLRFTDLDGHRFTCFATDARRGQLADLELRHRRRARCEDRIRCAKDTGLRNLPLHGFAQNQLWCELVAMASELTAWMQMLALDGPARAWEPKRLRLR
ncbi:MAG TPA: IS1380 family transposase, partial [Streptosporangiaceae bacterium]